MSGVVPLSAQRPSHAWSVLVDRSLRRKLGGCLTSHLAPHCPVVSLLLACMYLTAAAVAVLLLCPLAAFAPLRSGWFRPRSALFRFFPPTGEILGCRRSLRVRRSVLTSLSALSLVVLVCALSRRAALLYFPCSGPPWKLSVEIPLWRCGSYLCLIPRSRPAQFSMPRNSPPLLSQTGSRFTRGARTSIPPMILTAAVGCMMRRARAHACAAVVR